MTTYINNRKVHFDYEIKKTYEAGLNLLGFEVKAIKNSKGNLAGAFCIVRGNEVYLVGAHISPYQQNNTPKDYEPTRTRKLLLNKREIKELSTAEGTKGLTLVPLSLYSKGRHIKISIAIAQGKKKYDKRETIKKRDIDREMRREYK